MTDAQRRQAFNDGEIRERSILRPCWIESQTHHIRYIVDGTNRQVFLTVHLVTQRNAKNPGFRIGKILSITQEQATLNPLPPKPNIVFSGNPTGIEALFARNPGKALGALEDEAKMSS